MAGRITFGLIPGVAILLAVGAAFGQGMQTFKSEKAAQRHCPTEPSYGSTLRARTITLRAILRTVARRAALTFAKLIKMACTHGQILKFRRFQTGSAFCGALTVATITRAVANAIAIAGRCCAAVRCGPGAVGRLP
jgi:hypothetical protein